MKKFIYLLFIIFILFNLAGCATNQELMVFEKHTNFGGVMISE